MCVYVSKQRHRQKIKGREGRGEKFFYEKSALVLFIRTYNLIFDVGVPAFGRPNASAICGTSVMNGEGRAAERHRRRRRYQTMRPTITETATTPPATPPAIAPPLELLWLEWELGLGLVVELGADVNDDSAVPSGGSLEQRRR